MQSFACRPPSSVTGTCVGVSVQVQTCIIPLLDAVVCMQAPLLSDRHLCGCKCVPLVQTCRIALLDAVVCLQAPLLSDRHLWV